jgi:hypothetical protein
MVANSAAITVSNNVAIAFTDAEDAAKKAIVTEKFATTAAEVTASASKAATNA